MLYDEYSKKIKKIANSKNFILKFRIIIIAVAALIVSLTIAFLATKGSVAGGISISETITYGQKYEYSAKAMFSDILGYEFRNVEDEEWTDEAPIYPGSYEVRVQVNKAFGVGYSKPTKFKIIPKDLEITINEDEILYGQYPTYSQAGLLATDSISSLSFEFEDITKEKTLVNPVMDSIDIFDKHGVDVTDCYNITANGKELKFIKRTISLQPISISSVYNGEGIKPTNSYTITSPNALGYSDVLEIKTIITDQNGQVVEEAILPGVYTSTIEVVKILSNGLDVTTNYNVQKVINTIEILKRPITVVTSSASKTYDGTELSSLDFALSLETQNELLEDHSLKLAAGGKTTSATLYTPKPIDNVLEIGVYNSDGDDITALYDINYVYGALSIDKLDLTVISGSSNKEYDGTPLTNNSFTVASGFNVPASDELVFAAGSSSITNVGTVENRLSVKAISGDIDVTDSYNISYINGSLTVNPRNITVKPLDISDITYNGLTGIYESYAGNYSLISGELVSGEDINISVNITPNSGTSLTDVGTYTVSYKDYTIVGGQRSNYSISADGVTEFNINPRDITVSLVSYSAVYYEDYSYNPSSYVAIETTTGNTGLIGTDRLAVDVIFDNTPVNAGQYGIGINSHTFTSGNSNNYIVRYEEGYHATLTVTKRPIVIAPMKLDSKVYSNEYITYPNDDFVIISDNNRQANLTELHNPLDWLKLEASSFNSSYEPTSIINAGNYYFMADSYTCSDMVTNNYDITLSTSYVPFEVTKREITVKALEHEVIYNNTYYIYPSNDYAIVLDNNNAVNTKTLLDGSTFEIGVKYLYENENIASVYQAGIYDVYVSECYMTPEQINNYSVSYSAASAKLTINKQTVEISTFVSQNNKVYDGIAYEYDPYSYRITRIGDQAVSYTSFTDAAAIRLTGIRYIYSGNEIESIVDAGVYTIEATSVEGNEYFNRNYTYSIVGNSQYTIVKRSMTVTAANLAAVTYDNTDYSYPTNYMVLSYVNGDISTAIVTHDFIKLHVAFYNENGTAVTPHNAGRYTIEAIGVEVDDSFARNNEVIYIGTPATFEILKRDVILSPVNIEPVVYNGMKAIYPNDKYIISGGLGENGDEMPSANITVDVEYRSIIGTPIDAINAGTYYMFMVGANGSYNNYNISFSTEEVVFTILKREIVIQAAPIEGLIYGQTPSYDSSKYVIVKDNNEDAYYTSLPYGGSICVDVQYKDANNNIVNPVDAGTYYIDILAWYCDMDYNYTITVSDELPSFTISPRKVTIKALSDYVIYSNTEYVYNVNNYEVYDEVLKQYSNSLYNGEWLTINVKYVKDGNEVSPINAGTYTIVVTGYVADSMVENNYDISISEVNETLIIARRNITLGAVSLESQTYKQEAYTYDSSKYTYEYDYSQGYTTDILKTDENALITVEVEFRQNGYEKEPVNAGTYEIYVVAHTASSNYNVTYSENPGMFTIVPKTVKLKPLCDGEVFTYTGLEAEYTKNKYVYLNDEDVFLGDDNIYVSTYPNITPINVGTYEVYLALLDMEHGLSSNYDVYTEIGQITINPRAVTIAPNHQEAYIYDNYEFVYPVLDYVVVLDDGRICEDDHLYNNEYLELHVEFIDENDNVVAPINAGTYYIRAVGYYVDYLTENNYEITLSEELVEFVIIPRGITISAISDSVIYSNTYYEYDRARYNVYDNVSEEYNNGLFDNSALTINVKYVKDGNEVSPINAGTYTIVVTGYVADSMVENNYDISISEVNETLIIARRNITLGAVSLESQTYKQEAYTYDSSKYTYEYDYSQGYTTDILKTDENALITVEVEFRQNGYEKEPVNAGTYEIYVVAHTASSNYNVTYSENPGMFTIVPKTVKLKPLCDGEVFTYTGLEAEYTKNKYVYLNDEDVFLGDDNIYVSTYPNITPINAGTYTISLRLGEMTYGLASNYEIQLFDSTITITKRAVVIAPTDQVSTYSGTYYEYPITDFGIAITEANEVIYDLIYDYLINNLTIVVSFTQGGVSIKPKDVGTYSIHVNGHNTNSETMNNYSITYSSLAAELEIIKRNVSIAAIDQADYTYSGQAYTYPNSSFVIYDNGSLVTTTQLVDGSSITVDVIYKNLSDEIIEPINAGSYKIYINDVIFSDPLKAKNYHVDYSTIAATLNIIPRDVAVKLQAIDDKTYDGNAYTYDSSSFVVYMDNGSFVNKTELFNNEVLDLEVFYTLGSYSDVRVNPKNANTYYAYIEAVNTDALTSSNYNISYSTEAEKFTIEKLSILVMPKLIDYTYGRFDGTVKTLNYDLNDSWKYVDEYTASSSHKNYVGNTLLNGDLLSFDCITNPALFINAGDYTVYLNNLAFTPGEIDGSVDNYKIYTYTETASIDKADITLEAIATSDTIYNDNIYYYHGGYRVTRVNDEDVNRSTLLNGEYIYLKVDYYDVNSIKHTSVKNAGSYRIVASGIETSDSTIEQNYNITYSQYSYSFEIAKREIKLSPVGSERAYSGEEYMYGNQYSLENPDMNNDGYSSLLASHSLSINVYFIDSYGNFYGHGYSSNPVDIGLYTIIIAEANITNGNGDNVNDNYEFLEHSTATLEISKYQVTIKAKPQVKEAYDGEAFVYPTATLENPYTGDEYYKSIEGVEVLEGSFVKDDSIQILVKYVNVETGQEVVDEFSRYIAPSNAGQYYIRIIGHNILNASNENYDIAYVNSDDVILTIGKRTVYYRARIANNLTFNFEAQGISPYAVYAGASTDKALHSLVGNDSFEFDYTVTDRNGFNVEIRNAMTYYLNIIEDSIVFTEGLASNYNLVITTGTFTVSKLKITVAYSGNEKTYDAAAIEVNDEDFTITVDSTGNPLGLDFNILGLNVSYNEMIVNIDDCINAGKYTISASEIYFVDEDEGNFNITYTSGDYIVNKVVLNVALKDLSFTYSGKEIAYDLVNTRTIDGNVVNNQIIKVHAKFTSVDLVNQEVILSTEKLPVHAGTYTIEYLSYEQYDQFGVLEDASGLNYIIEAPEPKSLVINKAIVYISTNDVEYIYDENPYIYDTSNYTKDSGLTNVYHDTFKFNVYYVNEAGDVVTDDIGNKASPKDAGTYDIRIDLASLKQTYNGNTTVYDDYVVYENEGSIGKLHIYKANINIEITNTSYVSIYGDNQAISYICYDDEYNSLPTGYTVTPIYSYLNVNNGLYVDEPINVGIYKAEVVDFIIKYNNRDINKNNYQITVINVDAIRYEIIQRDILVYVDNYEKVYDGIVFNKALVGYYINNLLAKDKDVITVSLEYYLNEEVYTEDIVNASIYDIRIVNVDFTDDIIKDNYSVSTIDGSINISPRLLQFSVSLTGKTQYDGKDHYVGDNWSYYTSSLTPVLDATVTPVFGYVANDITYEVMNDAYKYSICVVDLIVKNGLSTNYTGVVAGSPTYEITKLPVVIKTGSLETYYTGEEVVCTDGFTVSEESLNGLVEGHIIQWDEEEPTKVAANKVTSPEGVNNRLGAVIYYLDDKGAKHYTTHNYNVTYEYGKIIVNPRPITLISGTLHQEYQGSSSENKLVCEDFEIGANIYNNEYYGLAKPDHVIEVTSSTVLYGYTGEPVDNVQVYKITSNNGIVTSCYDIEYVYGELFLTKAAISIDIDNATEDDNLLYNGKEYNILDYITLSKDITSTGDKIDPSSIKYLMIKNQYGEAITPVEYDKLMDAGTYKVNISGIRIVKKSSSSVDLTSCYDITFVNTEALFVIIPLVVEIQTYDLNKVWDGTDLECQSFEITNSDTDVDSDSLLGDGKITSGLLSDHYLKITSYAVLSAYNANGDKNLTAACENEILFDVYDDNGELQSQNYIIETSYGTLEFVQDIELYDYLESVYDGEEVTLEEINKITANPRGVSRYSNLSISYTVKGVYSDYNHTIPASILDLGTYYLDIDYDTIKIYTSGVLLSEDELAQLNISFSNFNYYVYARNIAIRPKSISIQYDGELHDCTPDEYEDGINYEIIDDFYSKEFVGSYYGLIDGHYAVIETSLSPKSNIYSTRFYITERPVIYDSEGNDVSHYYNIYYSPYQFTKYNSDKKKFYSNFAITKIVLEYETASAEKVYDNTPLFNSEFISFNEELLLDGHYIDVDETKMSVTNASTKQNKISFVVRDENGNDVSKYYDKTSGATYGKLVVTKREITITTGSAEKVYDGKPLTCNEFTWQECNGDVGLLSEHTITLTITGTITYKGSTSNKTSSIKITDTDGKSVLSNYDYTIVYGILTIKGTYE